MVYGIRDLLYEHIRSYVPVLGIMIGLLMLGWGSMVAIRRFDERRDCREQMQSTPKVFSRTVAEDLRVSRHGVLGVDFIRCGKCWIEKRKHGFLTFGGLNVLVMENLSVILPPDTGDVPISPVEHNDDDVVRQIGVSDGFLAQRGIPYHFSGVRISGFKVGRLLQGNCTEEILSARLAEAVKGGLSLDDCTVLFDDGERRCVGKALLAKSSGKLRLRWAGGGMDLK